MIDGLTLSIVTRVSQIKFLFTIMAKLLSPLERVSDKLSTIHTAMDALLKHTTKAVDIRTKADRTTIGAETEQETKPEIETQQTLIQHGSIVTEEVVNRMEPFQRECIEKLRRKAEEFGTIPEFLYH